jgi:hypothetical protein
MRIRLVIALFAFSAAVQASSTLRVGSQVLTAGDSRERVIELLGKPTSKAQARMPRSPGVRRGGVRVVQNHQGG